MNIKQAKKQIKNTILAYLEKDEYGNPFIEATAQRPIILIGPPGIGKTAIMKQIASELNLPLVSYSMTHHTRQSVLGLPIIVEKPYGKISEYTTSEIIGELYEVSNNTHTSGGILFLDEINSVSETLMPTMLQFLQYKVLGQHTIPEGWIIVTAGNPTEYNKGAKDFDVVTWDRLKRIDVEPDYPIWKEYSLTRGIHGAITTYLDIKKENFYKFSTTVDGNQFITARGWEDLSDAMLAYEKLDIEVDEKLIKQYLQDEEIADDFSNYYQLYKKYESDYQVDSILNGTASNSIKHRAKEATFDERYSLIGLILTAIIKKVKMIDEDEDYLKHLLTILKEVKLGADINVKMEKEEEKRTRERRMGILTSTKNKEYERVISFLAKHLSDSFEPIKEEYDTSLIVIQDNANQVKKEIENIFHFIEEVFETNEELTIFTTELTVNYYCAHFISRHNIDIYSKYASELSLKQRELELLEEVEKLD